jgi:hypothetical protein
VTGSSGGATDTKSFMVNDTTVLPGTPVPQPLPPTDPVPTNTGAVTKVGTGSDTLTLKITQDAYQGDAQYAVYVDGKQIGATFTAKALHNSGVYDTLEIKGDWGVGNHTVSVKLLNDLYGGSATTDRNLYVESATYNGAAVTGSSGGATDTKSFMVNDTTVLPGTPVPQPLPPTDPVPTNTGPVGSIKLAKTTAPIKSSYAGQIIENLDIWVESGNAVTITHDNVILRNVRIHHKTGDGVHVENTKGVQIYNAEIRNMDPPTGVNAETSETFNNIELYRATGTKIDHVSLHDGSTGIYAHTSPQTIITNVDGHNFHGAYPRGQFVQFSYSDGSKLDGFYNFNSLTGSRTEDNVNVFNSKNVQILNGVIDGNNSPSGVGVLFEGASDGGIVRNVDVIHQSNGGFSSYSNNVDFFDVRVFDGHMNTASGRGAPDSNGLSFAVTASGVGYDDATYTRPANSNNIFWGSQPAEFKDIRHDPGAVVMDYSNFTNEWNWII